MYYESIKITFLEGPGLEKSAVQSSGMSRYSCWASSFSFSLTDGQGPGKSFVDLIIAKELKTNMQLFRASKIRELLVCRSRWNLSLNLDVMSLTPV